ncbi:hypothetical protein UL076_004611 [Klebsiella pneumoniae]|uniref:hypothetical protein n=1 Tax=Klebsiella pneumoniae TaxID=573 RepID=UPI00254D9FE9|nr:hypothetical protein [Klebsiella pneumoniae]ELZ3335884.1 hypothetical protein [Klebsiella pneumoniae]MDK6284939.1 hypothetical protein [Klebsiella pneumoniae]HBQ1036370.1 hypothetical protein [Klebsiella pneumoniae]HBW1195278.1 hypothetical protein [Klebsiella pneumoniae]
MKIQLARLYRGGRFYGFGIAVNGHFLNGLTSVIINTETRGIPTLAVREKRYVKTGVIKAVLK